MGKVAGIRAKKHSENNSTFTAAPTRSSDIPPSTPGTHRHQSDFTEEILQASPEQSVLSWTSDFDLASNNELLDWGASSNVYDNAPYKDPLAVNANHGRLSPDLAMRLTPPTSQSYATDLDLGMGNSPNLRGSVQNQRMEPYKTLAAPVSPPSTLVNASDSRFKSQNDSQCVLACTQIISSLENYIATDLRSEELILNVSQCAAEQLNTLVDMQKEARTVRCLILFSTVLHQLFELLEVGCSTVLAERNGQCSSMPNVLSSELKSFGKFGMGSSAGDLEEQLAWKARKMAKVLQHTMEILRKVSALVRAGPRSQTMRQAVDRDWCFNDLMHRITCLHSQLCSNNA